jgi:uncharacterized cupredoxin-like copper-binding protein
MPPIVHPIDGFAGGTATNVPWRPVPDPRNRDGMSKHIPLIGALALPAVALAIVAAGCGGSSNSNASASSDTSHMTMKSASGGTQSGQSSKQTAAQGQVLKLSADPGGQLRFTKTKLTAAKPGRVTLVMFNPSSAGMEHGIAIDGNGVDRDGPIVAAGKTSRVTADLKQGTYTYYCPVPGHRQAGMTGTLTVK